MAEGRSSGSGERRVYRNGSPTTGRPARTTSGGSGSAPNGRGTPKPRRARAGRPLWQRILLALIVVLAVAAVSFLIGYLIGLKLAIVSFGPY